MRVMQRFVNYSKNKFLVSILSLLLASFFLALPASAQAYRIEFLADRTQIWRGECVNISWDTDNVESVYYNGRGVSGINQTRFECPTSTTVYNLLVNTRDGQQINRQIYVEVSEPPSGWVNPNNNRIIEFSADRTQIQAGECLRIYWHTANVRSVYYNGRPVSGIDQTRLECPGQDTTYNLLVNTRTGQQIDRQIFVDVLGESYDRGEVKIGSELVVDLDENGEVSGRADDFRWRWSGGEEGQVSKADDDDDLRLAYVDEGSRGDFESLSRDECRDRLDDDDETQIEVEEETIACIRTDDGDYGKFRVGDIRSSDGRLEVDWYVWK